MDQTDQPEVPEYELAGAGAEAGLVEVNGCAGGGGGGGGGRLEVGAGGW